jgi:hypothetical protein
VISRSRILIRIRIKVMRIHNTACKNNPMKWWYITFYFTFQDGKGDQMAEQASRQLPSHRFFMLTFLTNNICQFCDYEFFDRLTLFSLAYGALNPSELN